MLQRSLKSVYKLYNYLNTSRLVSSECSNNFKVCVCGTGKTGQPLSMFLHLSKIVDELAMFDVSRECCSVGLDLSYLNLECQIKCYSEKIMLKKALKDSRIVICTAALPEQDGISILEMFPYNAKIVGDICDACANVCPEAVLLIYTSPVNSMLPLACEIMKKAGKYNPKKVLGITSLDVVRCSAIASRIKGMKDERLVVPVVGGSSDTTLVPVLSKVQPSTSFTQEEAAALTQALRHVEADVAGCGRSAPMSAAYSAASFTLSVCRALKGEDNIQECCLTAVDGWLGLGYIAAPVRLGREGVEEVLPISLNTYEGTLLESVKEHLKKDILRGTEFARRNQSGEVMCSS